MQIVLGADSSARGPRQGAPGSWLAGAGQAVGTWGKWRTHAPQNQMGGHFGTALSPLAELGFKQGGVWLLFLWTGAGGTQLPPRSGAAGQPAQAAVQAQETAEAAGSAWTAAWQTPVGELLANVGGRGFLAIAANARGGRAKKSRSSAKKPEHELTSMLTWLSGALCSFIRSERDSQGLGTCMHSICAKALCKAGG